MDKDCKQQKKNSKSHLFQLGQSGNPAGRKKGSKNKFTSLKDAFIEVFEKLGGTEGLYEWVIKSEKNKALFYGWITKMLPTNIDIEGKLAITFEISEKFMPKNGK